MKKLGLALLAYTGFFMIAEGIASLTVAVIDIAATVKNIPRDWRYFDHDHELGWVNRPNVRLHDLYGPGKTFSTNSQRFRGTREYQRQTTTGRVRVLVSGDSFAAGWGVDDADVWTVLMELNGLETLNLAVGGYGVDQVFLWARRVLPKFDYDVHLFTFITHDFERMKHDYFFLRPKPLVGVNDGRVEALNLPVREVSTIEQWWSMNGGLSVLRTVRSIDLAMRAFGPGAPTRLESADGIQQVPEIRSVQDSFHAMVRELHTDADARGARLILLHLPQINEYEAGAQTDAWRRWLKEVADDNGVEYWDLHKEFREVPEDEFWRFYIGELVSPTDPGTSLTHYNERGNAFLAEQVLKRLEESR